MRVLMFGWEFPPHFSGGLGIVCYELTKALSALGVRTLYVMPTGPRNLKADFVDLLIASNLFQDRNVQVQGLNVLLTPYVTSQKYSAWRESITLPEKKEVYSKDLFLEVQRFAQLAREIAKTRRFDLIHAHDWPTFPAAIAAKEVSGKPLIVHIHATEFDRSGGLGVNPYVYQVEREGMLRADVVITVSEKIKNTCTYKYGVEPEKIRVVHNAVRKDEVGRRFTSLIKRNDKVVLFLGRVTLQKGPDYFIEAARKVLDVDKNVKFVMAGTGDMLPRMIERVAELGMGKHFIFPGFVNREEAAKLYQLADVFVMPSVSEPFGITPLEAMVHETPVIISKQSGVAEVIHNCLKIDFWDVDELAEKILAVLHFKELHRTLKKHARTEVETLDWSKPAEKCLAIYREVLNG